MNTWQAILLGIVQGITEWLPVSSSGHLQIARAFIGEEASPWYDLLLHVGTLLVVLFAYRKRLIGLAMGLFQPRHAEHAMSKALLIGSIPIAISGFLLKDAIEAAFESLFVVGIALFVTASILWSTKGLDPEKSPRNALVVGCYQALALIPGISRSGSTLAGALHQGINKKDAADLAFLLAIPALVGATLFKLTEAEPVTGPMWIGIIASVITGYASLQWLRAVVAKHGIHVFAPYCVLAGLVALVLHG